MKKFTLRFKEVNRDIFDAIKDGRKKVETRAATIKYRNIKAGDFVILVCGQNKFEKQVKKATTFKTITAMLRKYKAKDINLNCRTKKELQDEYFSYPNYREKIKQCGLVALELK